MVELALFHGSYDGREASLEFKMDRNLDDCGCYGIFRPDLTWLKGTWWCH